MMALWLGYVGRFKGWLTFDVSEAMFPLLDRYRTKQVVVMRHGT